MENHSFLYIYPDGEISHSRKFTDATKYAIASGKLDCKVVFFSDTGICMQWREGEWYGVDGFRYMESIIYRGEK